MTGSYYFKKLSETFRVQFYYEHFVLTTVSTWRVVPCLIWLANIAGYLRSCMNIFPKTVLPVEEYPGLKGS